MKIRKRSIQGTLGSILLLLYCALSVTSYVPGFHNHEPTVRRSCCGESGGCSFEGRNSTDSLEEYSDGRHSNQHCSACMWQAMAKKSGTDLCLPCLFARSICVDIAIPSDPAPATSLYLLPETRAPPLS